MPLFGAYIHYPYCLSKCPYCDFSSRATSPLPDDLLLAAYARDLKTFDSSQQLTSIFFGGGTPSLMSPSLVGKIIDTLNQKYTFSSNIEITLECNPDAINPSKMIDFKSVGVNRLSMGVQSMTDSGLKQLGRRHTLQTALTQIDHAKNTFDNINIDLIYARPDQTLSDWESELTAALNLNLPHYSFYQLTIEEDTPFAKQKITPVDDILARDMYLLTHNLTQQKNILQYEVSNYAQPNFQCQHNLCYWLGGDYIGIGPAAHGRLGLTATHNEKDPLAWLQSSPHTEQLTPDERYLEKLMMHLRLTQIGYPSQNLSRKNVDEALHKNWITESNGLITPTLEGTLMLNSLILLLSR